MMEDFQMTVDEINNEIFRLEKERILLELQLLERQRQEFALLPMKLFHILLRPLCYNCLPIPVMSVPSCSCYPML